MEGTTMTVVANLTVKMPRIRLRMARLAIFALAPFIRSEATGQRIGDALIAWVQRGLRVSVT
jgi:hypothetical protein